MPLSSGAGDGDRLKLLDLDLRPFLGDLEYDLFFFGVADLLRLLLIRDNSYFLPSNKTQTDEAESERETWSIVVLGKESNSGFVLVATGTLIPLACA